MRNPSIDCGEQMELSDEQHWTITRLTYWHLDRGRFEEAEALARGLLALDQRDGVAWHYYGEACLQQDDRREAVRAFSEAARLMEDRPDVWLKLAVTLLGLDRVGEAKRALTEARQHTRNEAMLSRIEALLGRCG